MHVYFISGLGADKRTFQFLDLSWCNPVFTEWPEPQEAETLARYALRLKETIPEEKPVIVGLSFGGMLATEIAKACNQSNAIIISGAKTFKEIPPVYRAGKYFPVYRWLPHKFIKNINKDSEWFFGIKSTAVRKLFKTIIEETNLNFTEWAIDAILNWKNEIIPPNITHIHGTADRILPYKYVKADYAIAGGGHLMVMENATEISRLLKKIILNDQGEK